MKILVLETYTVIANTAGIVVLLGTIVGLITEKINLPKMVGLILTGIGLAFLKPEYLVDFSTEEAKELTLAIAELGLFVVLYQEGMHISLKQFIRNIGSIIILATIGVILTVGITGIVATSFIVSITGLQFSEIFLVVVLLAAIVVPTDPAATFAILKRSGGKVKKNVETIIGGESAFNDVVAILLVIIVLLPQVESGQTTLDLQWMVILFALKQLLGGILLGTILAIIALFIIARVNNENEVTAISMTLPLAIFSIAPQIKISGAIAALTAGIIIHNPHYIHMRRKYKNAFMEPFWNKMVYLIEIFAFIFIGSLFEPTRFLVFLLPALLLSLLVLSVRALSVFLSTSPLELFKATKHQLTVKTRIFITLAGLKGLTSAVLALLAYVTISHANYLVNRPQELAEIILYTSLTLVLVSGIIQGVALNLFAKKTRCI